MRYCLALGLFLGFFFQFSYAQTELWGITSGGGDGAGTIFKTDGDGDYIATYPIPVTNPGYRPELSELCEASNGVLYGMTPSGGANGKGTLFSFEAATHTLTKLIDFNGTDNGESPSGSLIQASNGLLYGMTSQGGANNLGTLFSLDPTTNTIVKYIDFNGTANGQLPNGSSLTQATDGLLYGMTSQGGANNYGTLFSFDLTTNTLTKRIDFNGTTNGLSPRGSLIQANNGLLYGMTLTGGTNSMGTLFSIDPTTHTLTKHIDFNGTANGRNPYGSLTQAANGQLYGMTSSGGANSWGTLFSFDPTNHMLTKHIDFNGTANGQIPYGSIIQANNGLLYGMTQLGGANSAGTLFSLDPATHTLTRHIDFNDTANGRIPRGSLKQAANGLLYGMTQQGGANSAGTLFEFNPTTATLIKHIDFNGTANGRSPYGSLIQATDGLLYGMALLGGANNLGILFSLDPATNTLTKHIDFTGTANGQRPYGSLIQASNELLYGMTWRGGGANRGILFSFDPTTHTLTKHIEFNGTANGQTPQGSLVEATNGLLYGMTQSGGTNNRGTLFSFDVATNTLTKHIDFTGTANGQNPYGSLIQSASGLLYGMTYQGGVNNGGTLFSFDPATHTLTKHIDFNGTTGGSPKGCLTQATNGLLYGMTSSSIFSLNTTTHTLTKHIDFNGTIGGSPKGSLTQATNGLLYGMASGGANNLGILFSFDPATNILVKKMDFDGSNGSSPQYGSLTEITASTLPVTLLSFEVSQRLSAVELSWQTASEINNDYFTLELSQNGKDWETVANLAGHGNSNEPVKYETIHTIPFIGSNFYKLSQTDYDGTYEELGIQHLVYEPSLQNVVYPNPASNVLILSGKLGTHSAIKVYNLLGQEMTDQVAIKNSSGDIVNLDVSLLINGFYQLQVNDLTFRFIIE